MRLLGGIEGGGTKFVCAVGVGPDQVHAEVRFPTTTPDETLSRAVTFFRDLPAADRPDAVGIASFGPVDPQPASPTWGYITSTPKAGWANTEFAGRIQRELGVPVAFDTDCNAAALAEWRWGAAQGLSSFLYLTVGTGLGGGGMVEGQLIHGLLHPEVGHMRLPRHPRDTFPGACPFHGDCWEGMAAGPALRARWGAGGETLPEGHPAWEVEAFYLAAGLVNLICSLAPQRLILGGGVMEQAHLFPRLRSEVQRMLNAYIQSPAILDRIDEYIVPPALGNRAGVLGAIALAERVVSGGVRLEE
jgi:fructokinase